MDATDRTTLEQENARLREQLADRDRLIVRLERRIASLEKDSSNSSKPPSSDPPSAAKPKPDPKPPRKKQRKGHKRRQRVLLPADRIDLVRVHEDPTLNPDLWERALDEDGQPLFRVLQQVEFDADRHRFFFTEHRFAVHRHRRTGRLRTTPRPGHLRGLGGQLFEPGMQAWVCSMKIETHASVRGIQRFVGETLDLPISTGYLSKVFAQAAEAMGPAYDRIAEVVRSQPVVHADETGHKEAGSRSYTWVATCPAAALFRVGVGRSARQLEALVGPGFSGVLISDFYSAYRRFAREQEAVQPSFCWAHLIREVKAAGQLPEKNAAIWSRSMRKSIGELFRGWHARSPRLCRRARDAIVSKCAAWMPWANKEVAILQKRLREHEAAYFRFIDTPGNLSTRLIEPTNNAAERELRPVVLYRRVSQGTRGEAGRRWWERGWSVRATLGKRQRSFFGFVRDTLQAAATGLMPPMPVPAA